MSRAATRRRVRCCPLHDGGDELLIAHDSSPLATTNAVIFDPHWSSRNGNNGGLGDHRMLLDCAFNRCD